MPVRTVMTHWTGFEVTESLSCIQHGDGTLGRQFAP